MQLLTAAPSTVCIYLFGAVLFTAAPNSPTFSNASELGTIVSEGGDCSFLRIVMKNFSSYVLQGVSMSCSEICVLRGAKTGFTHADEQRFTDAHVMTGTAEIVQVC